MKSRLFAQDVKVKIKNLKMKLLDEDLDQRNEQIANCFFKNESKNEQATLSQFVMEHVHSYKSGDYFGEKALSDYRFRQATILATTELHLGSVAKDEYRRCLAKFEGRRLLANIELLEQMPYFSHWSKNQIKKLLPSLNIIDVVKGQVLVQEDRLSDEIFIVRSGSFCGYKTYKQ